MAKPKEVQDYEKKNAGKKKIEYGMERRISMTDDNGNRQISINIL